MTTWRTMFEEVLVNSGRPSNEAQKAKLSIVTAIKQHAGEGFFLNETSFEFSTVDGQATYSHQTTAGYPRGLFEIFGPLRLHVAGDSGNVVELERVSLQRFRSLQAASPGRSQPECFTVHADRIELFPTPDATVHTIAGDGHAHDIAGEVILRHDGAVFKFYKPGTTVFDPGNEMDDDYPDPGAGESNAWFGDGYDMIRAYASYLMFGDKIHAKDTRPNAALQRYLEAKSALEQRSARFATPRFVEPYDL